jgi:hypothetical protein
MTEGTTDYGVDNRSRRICYTCREVKARWKLNGVAAVRDELAFYAYVRRVRSNVKKWIRGHTL